MPACAACKFFNRKCKQDCVFAPYFPPENPDKFTNVHKVFGANNVSKLLNKVSPNQREDAANSLAYEAAYRLSDPVYGCVGYISELENTLKKVRQDLSNAKKELARNHLGTSEVFSNVNHPGFVHQDPNFGVSAYQVMPYNMQPMMGGPAGLPQGALMIRDYQPQPPPQQQQILEAQQQQMFVNYEQQQHQQQNDLERFINDFDTTGGAVTATGFNQMMIRDYQPQPPPQQQQILEAQQQQMFVNYEQQQHQQQNDLERFINDFDTTGGAVTATGFNQMMIRDYQPQPPPQQQQILEAQQQQMFVNYEQQQHQQQNDLERFINDFDTTGGAVTATGFNQMIPAAAYMPSPLDFVSDEGNLYGHHIQQQVVEHSHSHHPQQLDFLPPALLLQQQQQQNAIGLHHQEQQHQQQNSTLHHLEQQQNSTLHLEQQQNATLHHQAQQQLQQDATLHHQAQQQLQQDATLHHQAQPQGYRSEEGKSADPEC